MIAKKFIKGKQSLIKLIVFFIIVIFAVGIICLLIASNLKMNQRRSDLAAKIESYKKEIADLQKENNKIQGSLFEAGNESNIEKEIRERLDLKKPGENVIVVVPPKDNGQTQQDTPKPFWQKLWEDIKSLWD